MLPSVLAVSFAEWTPVLVGALALVGLGLFVAGRSNPSTDRILRSDAKRTAEPFSGDSLPPVLAYRSTMMLLTCASILAVDFRSFPRRFAKCENYGTSLMDMGVGSFVFSNGLVSGRPKTSFRGGLLSALHSSLPVFALGIVRAIATRGANYQAHATEYGVHWNFFATLGMVAIGAGFAKEVERRLGGLPTGTWAAIGLGVSVAHQLVLNHGLEVWVDTAPRTDLTSANKEGLSSVPGYLALYFVALDIGRFAFSKNGTWWRTVRKFAIWGGAFWISYFVARFGFGIGVSRKLVNVSYVLWVSAFNTSFLAVYYAVDLIVAERLVIPRKGAEFPESSVLGAVSRNQLGVFLLVSQKELGANRSRHLTPFFRQSNVLTGLVNLSMDTLAQPTPRAAAIIAGYMFVVAAAAVVLDGRGLRLRFWSAASK